MSVRIVIRIIDTTPGRLTVRTSIQENTGLHDGTGWEQYAFVLRAIGDLLTSLWNGRISCGERMETLTLTKSEGSQTA